jgi:hypothetical protein
LINASKLIKEASRSERIIEKKESPPGYSQLNQLDNLTKASEIANTSTLKIYLDQRRRENNSSQTNYVEPQGISRQDSNIESLADTLLRPPTQTDDIRNTNHSKYSVMSHLTKLNIHKDSSQKEAEIPANPDSL